MLYPFESALRHNYSLDGLWQVVFDPKRQGEKKKYYLKRPLNCEEVAVPASLNEQLQDRDKYLNMDWVWYFREFFTPDLKGERFFLRFGSATHRADVYLNGEKLGSHEGGYLPFEFEVTGKLLSGKANFIAVRIDNILSETTVPQGNVDPSVGGVTNWRVGNLPNIHYDYFPFMGLHRSVLLCSTGSSRLEKIRVTTEKISGKVAQITIETNVSGRADSVEVSIPETGFKTLLPLNENGQNKTARLKVARISSWSPETPKLYDINFKVKRGGEVTDHYVLPFGFRTVKVKGGKLLLNGKQVFLKGCARHEDSPVIGKGDSPAYRVKDYGLLKWLGANSFRTSHYPYAEEDMYYADRHGFMVIDEVAANTLSLNALKGDESKRKELVKNHKAQIEALIERDYNHPSVLIWSLGNECESFIPEWEPYFKSMLAYGRTLDANRLFTFIFCRDASIELTGKHCDIVCINIYPGWYINPGRVDLIEGMAGDRMDGFWKRFKKPVIITEFGADAITGLHDEHNLMWTEEYQEDMVMKVIHAAEKRPFVCGTHIWVFADFRGGQHTGRVVSNCKGVFTRDRHPKLLAHTLRKHWKGE